MVPPRQQMSVTPRELRRWRRRLPLSEEEIKEHSDTFAQKFPAGGQTIVDAIYHLSWLFSGLMSKDDFTKLASPYLPESKLDEFTENTFKLFDEDKDGLLDFG